MIPRYSSTPTMKWIVLSLVVASTLHAQQAPARKQTPPRPTVAAKPKPKPQGPPSAPLGEILVKGNQHYKTEDIIAASRLKVGQRVLETDFEPARERLMATGGFETISYRYQPMPNGDGYSLTFEVLEIGRALPVRFEDLPIPDAELVKFLKDKEPLFGGDRAPGNTLVLERFAKELTEFLAPKGLKEPVAAQVIADNPGELAVLFRPNTQRPRVAQINFVGNQLLDTPTLANAFAIVSIGVEYKEQTVRNLLDTAIRPLYEARGYLGVQFPKIATKPKPEVQGLDVVIQVVEGKPYRYGQITAVGTGISSKEVFSIAGLKPEDVSNFDSVNAVPKRLIERMQRDGYMRAKASYDRKIDHNAQLVHLQFKTEPGTIYTFNKLHIKGLDLHGEPAIRKMWGLKYGKPFNIEYPQRFLNEVKDENMFDGLKETKFETKIDDKALSVDVLLIFR
jgi:outer membrane protein assembly factor BamA